MQKQIRLTKDLKRQIEHSFYVKNIKPKEDENSKIKKDFALKCLNQIWNEVMNKCKTSIDDLPEGVLPTTMSFHLTSIKGGHWDEIRGDFDQKAKIPFNCYGYGGFNYKIPNTRNWHEIEKEFNQILKNINVFKKSVEEVKREFSSMLSSITTYEKLKQVFPDIDLYYDFKILETVKHEIVVVDWKSRIENKLKTL